jgi:hypothetical protein
MALVLMTDSSSSRYSGAQPCFLRIRRVSPPPPHASQPHAARFNCALYPEPEDPTPNAQRPTPNAQRPTPNAQRPTPNAPSPPPPPLRPQPHPSPDTPRSHTVRTFVAILLSGTPAAANQLVMTQIHNPDGTAHTLASFLLLQCELFQAESGRRPVLFLALVLVLVLDLVLSAIGI